MLKISLLVITSIIISLNHIACKPPQEKQGTYNIAAKKLRQAIKDSFYHAATDYYTEHAEKERNTRPASYLWPLCALIQADETEQTLLKTNGLVDHTLKIIQKYYDPKAPKPGYASYPPALGGGDRFYDDNQWIGIALMDAWAVHKKQEYLDVSRTIYDFMMTAYDTIGGGGLHWEEGKPSKNTCSNGPGIILALQLYKATGEKPFLDTAIQLYDWVNKNLKDSTGLYWDNIGFPSGKVDSTRYSYNTGTMLQSAVYLYEITGQKEYLEQAKIAAKSAAGYFYSKPKLRDGFWFNAVLLRGYQHLLLHDNNVAYINAFKKCIDNELKEKQLENGLFAHKNKTDNLVNQAGMLEILNRLSAIEQLK